MTEKGIKLDEGKLRYSLIPTEATQALAEVLTFGANKYTKDGWKDVPNAEERYMDAAMRHLEAHRSGELLDSESNLSHLSHLLTNISFLIYFSKPSKNPLGFKANTLVPMVK